MAVLAPSSSPDVRFGRVVGTSVAALGTGDTVVTFSTTFADTNYTIVAVVSEATAGVVNKGIRLTKLVSKTAADATFRSKNDHPTTAKTPIIHYFAVHD